MHPTNRRQFACWILGALGSVPGCLTRVDEEKPTRQSSDGSADRDSEDDVAVVRATGTDISVEATLLRASVGEEQPPALSITFRNERDRTITVKLGADQPQVRYSFRIENGEWTPTGLMLVPLDRTIERQSDCWRPVREVGDFAYLKRTELDPGDEISNEYELWNDPDSPDCFPAGTYQFGNIHSDPPSWRVTLELELGSA